MVLGNAVRVVVGFYGVLQIIVGTILLISPITLFQMNNIPVSVSEINTDFFVLMGGFLIAIGLFFLVGVTRLQEKV